MRVSTLDRHPETQLSDDDQRGYQIVREYTDRISSTKARRPGLGEMMQDARRGRFEVAPVWASDRIERSVKHFLYVLDELNRLNVEFVGFREQIDTGGPPGPCGGRHHRGRRRTRTEPTRSTSGSVPACGGPGWKVGTSVASHSIWIEPVSVGTGSEGRVLVSSPSHTILPTQRSTACSKSTPQPNRKNQHDGGNDE